MFLRIQLEDSRVKHRLKCIEEFELDLNNSKSVNGVSSFLLFLLFYSNEKVKEKVMSVEPVNRLNKRPDSKYCFRPSRSFFHHRF